MEEIPWDVVAADRALVLSECSPSHATGSGRTGTGCSAWSLHRGLQDAFTTHRGEVTDSVPSSAHEAKTIPRWMFFLHLPKAKEAGYLILPGIGSGERRLLTNHLFSLG